VTDRVAASLYPVTTRARATFFRMAEKTAKKKTKKAAKASSDPSVLGNLRATRASRIGGDRGASAAKPKAPATKAKVPASKKPAAKPKPKPRAATTQPAAAKPAAAARPTTPPPPPPPEPPRDGGRPSTTEVVTTAVQAAGELAQIGLTVGRQVLKRATDRLPRP